MPKTVLAWFALATAGLTFSAGAAAVLPPGTVDVITPALIRSHLQFLSHDLLAGRNTGEPGYELAREYIVSQFTRIGLKPADGRSFVQPFELLAAEADNGSRVNVGAVRVEGDDLVMTPDWSGRTPTLSAGGMFAGYGVSSPDRDDYRGVDPRGRIVFLLAGVPAAWTDDPVRSLIGRTKINVALERGALGVILLQPTRRPPGGGGRVMSLADGSTPIARPLATIHGDSARRLLTAWNVDAAVYMVAALPTSATAPAAGAVATARTAVTGDEARTGAARPVGDVSMLRARDVSHLRSWNVVGTVPGEDPAVGGEAISITAHLDHVGSGAPDANGDRIYNGAHDNAIGIAKMLAAAEAMARLHPRRTLVFAAFGAEERGLLGSWYFTGHVVGAPGGLIANINHDGGLDGDAPDDVFAFGSEYSELGDALAETAKTMRMSLNRTLRAPFSVEQGLFFRSDQYSFLARGVPGIYLMDGFSLGGNPERGRQQWDNYLKTTNHQQRDNFDPAWRLKAPVTMSALSVRLAWRLAEAERRPRLLNLPAGIVRPAPAR